MMRVVKTIVCALCLFGMPHSAAAEVRTIFSVMMTDYDNAGQGRVLENSTVVKTSPRTSMLIKLYHDRRDSWDNSIVTLGPVIVLDRYHYLEVTYGYGRDADGRQAHFAAADLTRETARYMAVVGLRHSAFEGYGNTTLSPGIRYYLLPRLSVWGKYFMSRDSEGSFDQAYWCETGVRLLKGFELAGGYTAGNRLYSPEYETLLGDKAVMTFHSLLGRLSFAPRETLRMSYQFERLERQVVLHDIKHTVVVDIRF